MSALSIQVPFPVFQDRDGQPLDNGYVWIGEPSLNAQTNPVNVYFDEALTIAAAQPLRTLNGYIYRSGSPAQVYVDGVDFSILVQDSKGSLVYSLASGTGISANASGIVYDPAGTGAVPTTVQAKLREDVSVKDFGAVGDGVTDDTAAFAAAFAASKSVYVPEGTYLASVDLPRAGSLVGAGNGIFASRSATILVAPAGAGYAVQIDATSQTKQMCKVENISIVNAINDPTNVGINIKGNTVNDENDYHVFSNVTIRNFSTSIKVRGRMIYSTWNNVICYGGLTTSSGLTGIHLDSQTDPSDVSFNLNVFNSCVFSGAKAQGVKITGRNVTNLFQSCAIEGNNSLNVAGVEAFYIEESFELQIHGCYFESNGASVAVDNSTISNNSIDLHFSCGASSGVHYNPSIKDCWFVGAGVSIWVGKNNSVFANPGTFVRGGGVANSLLQPKTNGYAFYSSVAQLNRNDSFFTLDASNVFLGRVTILCDGNNVYPCVVRQSDSALTFPLNASTATCAPTSKYYVVTPDGSGADLNFTFLTAGMQFTIHNASSSYVLVINPVSLQPATTPFATNWTIPPKGTRSYIVEGVSGQTFAAREISRSVRITAAPPVTGYFGRGELIENINISAGGFIGYAAVAAGGAFSATRANTTAYTLGQWIAFGGTVNECVVAGTSAGSAPATPTSLGQLTTDGTVTWKCRALSEVQLKTYGAISA